MFWIDTTNKERPEAKLPSATLTKPSQALYQYTKPRFILTPDFSALLIQNAGVRRTSPPRPVQPRTAPDPETSGVPLRDLACSAPPTEGEGEEEEEVEEEEEEGGRKDGDGREAGGGGECQRGWLCALRAKRWAQT